MVGEEGGMKKMMRWHNFLHGDEVTIHIGCRVNLIHFVYFRLNLIKKTSGVNLIFNPFHNVRSGSHYSYQSTKLTQFSFLYFLFFFFE